MYSSGTAKSLTDVTKALAKRRHRTITPADLDAVFVKPSSASADISVMIMTTRRASGVATRSWQATGAPVTTACCRLHLAQRWLQTMLCQECGAPAAAARRTNVGSS